MSMMPYMTQPPVPVDKPGQGKAVASMVLGITSVVFCWWGLATLAMWILAITLGGVSIQDTNAVHVPRHGMAVAGLTLGIVGAVIYFILGIFTLGIMFLI